MSKRFLNLSISSRLEIWQWIGLLSKMQWKEKSGLDNTSKEEILGSKYGNVIPPVHKIKNVLAIRGRALPWFDSKCQIFEQIWVDTVRSYSFVDNCSQDPWKCWEALQNQTNVRCTLENLPSISRFGRNLTDKWGDHFLWGPLKHFILKKKNQKIHMGSESVDNRCRFEVCQGSAGQCFGNGCRHAMPLCDDIQQK